MPTVSDIELAIGMLGDVIMFEPDEFLALMAVETLRGELIFLASFDFDSGWWLLVTVGVVVAVDELVDVDFIVGSFMAKCIVDEDSLATLA